MRRIWKMLIILLILLAGFWTYVEIVNRNSPKMTVKQKLLKAVYPAFIFFKKISGSGREIVERPPTASQETIYHLEAAMPDGSSLKFDSLKGKKVLIVNTASNCGYTAQYDELQELYTKFNDKLVIIGFPANDFKQQEKGNDEEIAEFCRVNYGISFPLASKSSVIKGNNQHPVYQWLSNKTHNGWNDREPSWNFTKYLIDEEGRLTHYFGPAVSPVSDEVMEAVQD